MWHLKDYLHALPEIVEHVNAIIPDVDAKSNIETNIHIYIYRRSLA